MKGFALDENGDLMIENGQISTVSASELLKQKVWAVLHTNLREWFFDWDQGIDFRNILGKGTNAELARFEVERGLAQVDDSLEITEFSYTEDRSKRKAKIVFKAQTQSGEEVGGAFEWD